MKITITIPDEVYGELEKKRGYVPRSTYIQKLITGDTAIEISKDRIDIVNKKAVDLSEVKKLEKKGLLSKGVKENLKGEFKTYFK